MGRVFALVSLVVGSLAFSAEHVRFLLPATSSLALVQSLGAAKTEGVEWSAPAADWQSAVCEAALYRPAREDEALTLYDAGNRIECHGKNSAGEQTKLVLSLAKVGVQFWGSIHNHHSSTLVGDALIPLGNALNIGRRNRIGNGLFEPFNLCNGNYCVDANELLSAPSVWNGMDFDHGRIVLTCSQYRSVEKLLRTDCYLIDVAE